MFKMLRRGIAATVLFSLLASAGAAGLAVRQDAKLGPILTDDQGKTLYLYIKDEPGVTIS